MSDRGDLRAARLPRSFFEREVTAVARELLGCTLAHAGVGGRIVETEAYHESEPACHAHAGPTPRTLHLFGAPGVAYVYLSYGIHSLFNVVAGAEGEGAAVLIRAIEPTLGLERMRKRRRGRPDGELCSGPGRLSQALAITLAHDGADLESGPLELRADGGPAAAPVASPRIGISKAVELPWRFSVAANPFVSRPQPLPAAA